MAVMPISQTVSPLRDQPQPESLATARTIDRALVHRSSLSEVFVTDVLQVGPSKLLAAAQLPRSHAYWGDHLTRPVRHDPVLLVEVCRQAALAAAHVGFGVPAEDKFILTRQSLRVRRPDLLLLGDRPAMLLLCLEVDDRRERNGRTTGLDFAIELTMPGTAAVSTEPTVVADAYVGLRFKSPQEYAELRLRGREGRKPSTTADIEDVGPFAGTVAPLLVGRRLPENIVVRDVVPTDTGAVATLQVPGNHPSLFDHPQDHVPGMVLLEGARQLAIYALGERIGLAPGKAYVVGLETSYERFGELDAPLLLAAELPSPGGPLTDEPYLVRVQATQQGTPSCGIAVEVRRVCG